MFGWVCFCMFFFMQKCNPIEWERWSQDGRVLHERNIVMPPPPVVVLQPTSSPCLYFLFVCLPVCLKNYDTCTRFTVLDESINTDVCITSLAFFPANYVKLFPCNIASTKHLGSWENMRVVLLGKPLSGFVISQRLILSCSPNFPSV